MCEFHVASKFLESPTIKKQNIEKSKTKYHLENKTQNEDSNNEESATVEDWSGFHGHSEIDPECTQDSNDEDSSKITDSEVDSQDSSRICNVLPVSSTSNITLATTQNDVINFWQVN